MCKVIEFKFEDLYSILSTNIKREVSVVAGSFLSSQSMGGRNMGMQSYFINPSQWRNQSPKSGVWHLRKRTQLVLWSLHPHSCAYNYTEVHSNTRVCACARTHTRKCTHAYTHGGRKVYWTSLPNKSMSGYFKHLSTQDL